MGVVSFGGAIRTGQRCVKRARVLLSARIRVAGGDYDARLRDLSSKGALVECGAPAKAGDSVIFLRGEMHIPARVAWATDNRLGLQFERPVDESEVLVRIGRRPARRTEQDHRRSGILGGDFTEKERRLIRAWGTSVRIPVPND